jgi:hypothetical protein
MIRVFVAADFPPEAGSALRDSLRNLKIAVGWPGLLARPGIS